LLISGQKIVVNTPLINPEKVYLPPLHMKLGYIKNSFKAVDQNTFRRISDAEIKKGYLIGFK
jgi:hypothetical protein